MVWVMLSILYLENAQNIGEFISLHSCKKGQAGKKRSCYAVVLHVCMQLSHLHLQVSSKLHAQMYMLIGLSLNIFCDLLIASEICY